MKDKIIISGILQKNQFYFTKCVTLYICVFSLSLSDELKEQDPEILGHLSTDAYLKAYLTFALVYLVLVFFTSITTIVGIIMVRYLKLTK